MTAYVEWDEIKKNSELKYDVWDSKANLRDLTP